MCCQETRTLNLPPEAIEALAHYRKLRDRRGWDWGDEGLPDFFRWARFSLLGPVFEAVAQTGDWAGAVRSVIGDDVPPGIVVVRVGEDGVPHADVGPARAAIPGRKTAIDVVVDSATDADLDLTVAGREVRVAPRGAAPLQQGARPLGRRGVRGPGGVGPEDSAARPVGRGRGAPGRGAPDARGG